MNLKSIYILFLLIFFILCLFSSVQSNSVSNFVNISKPQLSSHILDNSNSNSINNNNNKLTINSCQDVLDSTLYTKLIRGDLESGWYNGWNMTTSNVIFSTKPITPLESNLQPYEGISFALFHNKSSILQSLPIEFANLSSTTLYTKLLFQFQAAVTVPTNHSYISISINDTEFGRLHSIDFNRPGYIQQSYDLTQFANGSFYIITLKYIDTKNDTNFTLPELYSFDYFTFISVPTKLLENDIYISENGSDINGDGSLTNPYCSLQHAVVSISSGYSIYLMSNISVSPILYSDYSFDTLSKEISFLSYISDNIPVTYTIAVNNTTPIPMVLVGANCNFTNLVLSNPFSVNYEGKGSLLTLASGNLSLLYTNFQLPDKEIGISAAVLTNPNTNILFQSGSVSGTFINLFNILGSGSISDSSFLTTYSTIFNLYNQYSDFSIDNCNFIGSRNILNATYFNTLSFKNSIIQSMGTPISEYVGMGDSAIFSNCTISDSSYMINLIDLNSLIFDGLVFQNIINLVQPIISLRDMINNTTISNTIFQNIPTTTSSLIYLGTYSLTPIIMSNVTFLNNQAQLINNIATVLEMYNTTLSENQYQSVLIQVRSARIICKNLNATGNMGSILAIWISDAFIQDSIFSYNQNPSLYPLGMLSFFESSIHLSGTQFLKNLNFHQLQIVNSTNSNGITSIVNCSFTSNYIGSIFVIQNSNVTFDTLTLYNNKLLVLYPFYIKNSQVRISNVDMVLNTQSMYISDSEFYLENVIFSQVLSTDNNKLDSIAIINSRGSISYCMINDCSPSGFSILYSHVRINDTSFMFLYGYDPPIATITNSEVEYNRCMMEHISGGETLLSMRYSNVSFFMTFVYNFTSIKNSNFLGFYSNIHFAYSTISYSRGNQNGFNLYDSSISFIHCDIDHNQFLGGYFLEQYNGDFYMDNTFISNNQAMLHFIKSNIIMNVVTFQDNQENPLIMASSSIIVIKGSTIYDSGLSHSPSIISSRFSSITIQHCIFTNGHSETKPLLESALRILGGDFSMTNTTVEYFDVQKGFLFLTDIRRVSIESCTFDNINGVSGAVLYSFYTTIAISSSVFTNNQATLNGGVIHLEDSELLSYGNNFTNNFANKYGGVFSSIDSLATIIDTRFTNNSVGYGAGAICFSEVPSCNLGNCTDFNPCSTRQSNEYGNIFEGNFIKNGYGHYSATGPKELSISIENTIHPNTSFVVFISEVDSFGQIVSILDAPISINLSIYTLEENNRVYFNYSTQSTLQGSFYLPLQIDLPVGTPLMFVASTSNGFSVETNRTLSMCDPGSFPSIDIHSCQQCPIGTYGFDGLTCFACKSYGTKVMCSGGSSLSISKGFWRLPNVNPPKLYSCDPEICLQDSCRYSQTGVLCSGCIKGYSKVKTFCESCDLYDGVNLYLLSGVVVFLLIYFFIISLFKFPSSSGLFNFILAIQTVAIISYNVRYIYILPLFNFVVDFWPTTCFISLNYLWKSLISLVLMLLIVIISPHLKIGKKMALRYLQNYQGFFIEKIPKKKKIFYSTLSNILMLYTPISFLSISLLACHKIGDEYRLVLDATIQCFDKHHIPATIIAFFLLIFIVAGAPLFLIFKIYRKDIWFFKMFFAKYRSKYIFWDLVLMVRSLIFVVCTIISFNFQETKGLILSSCGLIFVCVNWLAKPHKMKSQNDLETHNNLILSLSALIFNSRVLDNVSLVSGLTISLIGCLCFVSLAFYNYKNIKAVNKTRNSYEEIK